MTAMPHIDDIAGLVLAYGGRIVIDAPQVDPKCHVPEHNHNFWRVYDDAFNIKGKGADLDEAVAEALSHEAGRHH